MRVRLSNLIDPFVPGRIKNCSYELSLGSEVFITGPDATTKKILADGQQTSIPPGQFAQLLTKEVVEVPPDALGLISMKSTLKLGGLVNVSGFHVDPGFRGCLLFSVYNAGPKPILLSQGTPTFLLWYATLDGETEDVYDGKRGGRTSISDEDAMRIQGDVYTPHALASRVEALERHDLDERVKELERTVNTRLQRRDAVRNIVLAVLAALVVGTLGWAARVVVEDDSNPSAPTSSSSTSTTIPGSTTPSTGP